jgi:hypothetical protein
MPILTLEAIRENPWNVVVQPLPESPSELLLEVAYRAAEYCAASEFELMDAARDDRYTPYWWRPSTDCPDAHEESEARGQRAQAKLEEIGALYERLYDKQK